MRTSVLFFFVSEFNVYALVFGSRITKCDVYKVRHLLYCGIYQTATFYQDIAHKCQAIIRIQEQAYMSLNKYNVYALILVLESLSATFLKLCHLSNCNILSNRDVGIKYSAKKVRLLQ